MCFCLKILPLYFFSDTHTQKSSLKAKNLSGLFWCVLLHKRWKKTAPENLYLNVHSLFHRIPVYSNSIRNSGHIQEHSRHRSCRDRFHMKTENKMNIGYNIKTPKRWKLEILLIGSWSGAILTVRMTVKLSKGFGSLITCLKTLMQNK